MTMFISFILIIGFSIIPLLFWWYGNVFLREHRWNRARFFGGMFWGWISVWVILLFESFFDGNIISQIYALFSALLVISLITIPIIKKWSLYIQGFFLKLLWLHFLIFFLIILLGYIGVSSIDAGYFQALSLWSISGYVIAAYLEEWLKHISSIGLSSNDFRFSRRDLLVFTFFITLGFITLENLLYFHQAYDDGIWIIFLTWIQRIFFALPLHIFAASICVMLWWKALSYKLFSWRYILFFTLWFLLATGVHTLYNILIVWGYILPIIILTGVWYMAFTQWIIDEEI